jgi:CBS domain containing-hemolysin-like protein
MPRVINILLTVTVWASIFVLVVATFDAALIDSPLAFWFSLVALLLLSSLFSSAETAFTILQEEERLTAETRAKSQPEDAAVETQLVHWFNGGESTRFRRFAYRTVSENASLSGFATLLPFLLVVNNVTNLSGMFLIGMALVSGPASGRLSLVISSVVVVLVGEVTAKFLGRTFVVQTAVCTSVPIAVLKPLLSWYTSRLVTPVELILQKVGERGVPRS